MAKLVTGGTGYIGSETVRQLVNRGEEVVVFDVVINRYRIEDLEKKVQIVRGDLGNFPEVLNLFRENKFDAIYHMGSMLSYAAENAARWDNRLTVAHNTFYSWSKGPLFISNRSDDPANVLNNVFGGAVGLTAWGPATVRGNRLAGPSDFADPSSRDYRLAAGVRGIDAAQEAPGSVTGSIAPAFEPLAPLQSRPRPTRGPADIGAFEWCP